MWCKKYIGRKTICTLQTNVRRCFENYNFASSKIYIAYNRRFFSSIRYALKMIKNSGEKNIKYKF